MASSARAEVVLLVDDDPDDLHMTRRALAKSGFALEVYSVGDGEELLDYLRHSGKFAPPALSPRPALVLLDLNMPKMDGREALAEIKADQALKAIPVVVMTTSTAAQDIARSYDLGCNSFISKPITLAELVQVTQVLGQYWFGIAKLPQERVS